MKAKALYFLNEQDRKDGSPHKIATFDGRRKNTEMIKELGALDTQATIICFSTRGYSYVYTKEGDDWNCTEWHKCSPSSS